MEEKLKNSLLHSVHKLEQKRLSLQRELLLRSMEKSSVRSAVVVPSSEEESRESSTRSSKRRKRK